MRSGIARCPWLKVVAAFAAFGLHVAVLAMVLSAPVAQVSSRQPEALDVQFVELAPMPAAAPVAAGAPAPAAADAEPVATEAAEAAPAAHPEPEPAAQPAPARKPEPKPKPKPKPRPRPTPVHTPRTAPSKVAPQREAMLSRAASPPSDRTDASEAGPSESRTAQVKPQAAAADRPRTVGQADYLGKRPTPVYPRLSERRGEQGRVMLRVLISAQGRVTDVDVQHSSGYARLDEAAVQAMRQARFRPYTENGVAYPALVDIPFDFVL